MFKRGLASSASFMLCTILIFLTTNDLRFLLSQSIKIIFSNEQHQHFNITYKKLGMSFDLTKLY